MTAIVLLALLTWVTVSVVVALGMGRAIALGNRMAPSPTSLTQGTPSPWGVVPVGREHQLSLSA